MVAVAGIDPSGSPRRPSGVAVIIDGRFVYIGTVFTDREIIDPILGYGARIAAIDSPLSHAPGYRRVDIAMKRAGYPVLPPGWRGMRMLVERSLRLADALRRHGVVVIETHPRSALRSSGCSDPGEAAEAMGIEAPRLTGLRRDAVDAVVAALVAYAYASGQARVISDADGEIYLLPRLCSG